MNPGTKLSQALSDPMLGSRLVAAIRAEAAALPPVSIMEVCGTHTVAIRRAGIPGLLPPSVRLVSGPGCPVCVTPNSTLDRAIALAAIPGVTVATFGDMLRVPGTRDSLAQARARGADVRVVYSPLDAVRWAREHPERKVIFLGVGFETTAPTAAAALLAGREVPNFYLFSAHKLVPPALAALFARPDFAVDGLLLPGHVSVVIGAGAYRGLSLERRVPCVVAGFEPADVLLAILMLLRQMRRRACEVEIEYRMAVSDAGNRHAQELISKVFTPVASAWRGLGEIPGSGLAIRPEFAEKDAGRVFPLAVPESVEAAGCLCGQVLVGAVRPPECPLFGTACDPAHPVGPCMVSSEGTCAAYHRYGG
jgi:hydrogenase expression/formation protein HypD